MSTIDFAAIEQRAASQPQRAARAGSTAAAIPPWQLEATYLFCTLPLPSGGMLAGNEQLPVQLPPSLLTLQPDGTVQKTAVETLQRQLNKRYSAAAGHVSPFLFCTSWSGETVAWSFRAAVPATAKPKHHGNVKPDATVAPAPSVEQWNALLAAASPEVQAAVSRAVAEFQAGSTVQYEAKQPDASQPDAS